MKRILLAITLALGLGVVVQAQTTQKFSLTSGSPIGSSINEIGSGITQHLITWNASGTVSTCSVKVQQSPDNTSWSDLITSQSCTSTGGPTTAVSAVANYVRVNATTLTGSGILTVTYKGLTTGAGSTTITGNVAATVADCASATLGCKADARSTATDTTPATEMQVLKEMSYVLQNAVTSDPCSGAVKLSFPVNIATATTTVVQAASASNKFYTCNIFLQTAGTVNVAYVEDASGSCASPDAGIIGGTTTGTGIVITSGAGSFVLGNGGSMVAKTASTNVNVCLITSANVQLSGVITGVLNP